MERKLKVFVNLEKNQVTVQRIKKTEAFSKFGRFGVEGDHHGGSWIEKRDSGYYSVNRIYARDGQPARTVQEKRLTAEEAKKIIRETVKDREERY